MVWIGTLAGYQEPPPKKPRKDRWYDRQWRRLSRRLGLTFGQAEGDTMQDWHVSREQSAPLIQSWIRSLFKDWGSPASVIFDQNRSTEIAGLLSALRRSGIARIISLPVSPWININVLRQTDFIRVDSAVFWKKHDYSGFDGIGQVDPYYSDSLRSFFRLIGHPSPFQGREQMLGSIRYTEDWLVVRETHVVPGAFREFLPPISPQKRRLLVIPSHRKNNSFWEEYIRTLHFLAQFDDYDIVVKPHTRYGNDYDDLPEEITLLPEIDTSSLIDWSEIILFWSSSVALEGFQKGRTMINLDFLNGNRSIYADLGAGFQCRSRDDVLAVLCSQEVLHKAELESREGCDLLLKHVIQGGGDDKVVERYLNFIQSN